MRCAHGVLAPLVGLVLLASVGGCTRTAACSGPDCSNAGTETGGDGDGDGDGDTGGPVGDPVNVSRDVDILFVIDNSGSMGEEQAILAQNFGAFIDVLENPDVNANYRIGITTTDNGNPWCPQGTTTPEAGKLVMSSCKSRINDFLFNNGEVDVQDLACNDICTLSDAELEILPTTTFVDANPRSRPWLENIEGKKNIPASTSSADAFACFGPQGINGCGFESPLESMYLSLVRAQNTEEASYGFLRPHAILAVVFVTDEADCSYNKDYASIFEPDGNKAFWSDPDASFPTSAVCWNAGVECFGDPSNYDGCEPVNKDVNGNSGVADAQAVLHPMSRYMGILDGIEEDKQQLDPESEIIVALIAGVDATGNPFYHDVGATDPEFQGFFGVGPGCTAPNPLNPNEPVEAVPPVRLRMLSDHFTPDNMFSICESDYSAALAAIADAIRVQIKPACFSQCVADTNPATEVVNPNCVVTQDPPGNDTPQVMQECLRDANGYVIDPGSNDYAMPSDDVNVCFAMLVDPGGLTPDIYDDMADECLADGFNLQFVIARRPGFPEIAGTTLEANCILAQDPATTCPGL